MISFESKIFRFGSGNYGNLNRQFTALNELLDQTKYVILFALYNDWFARISSCLPTRGVSSLRLDPFMQVRMHRLLLSARCLPIFLLDTVHLETANKGSEKESRAASTVISALVQHQ